MTCRTSITHGLVRSHCTPADPAPAPQFRAVVRLKNNRLVRAREAQGWSQAELGYRAYVSAHLVNEYENLKVVPWLKDGLRFKKSARKLARTLKTNPWLLWADVEYVTSTTQTVEFDHTDDAPWLGAPQTPLEALEVQETQARHDRAMASLSPMRRRILEWRLDGWTTDEIGKQYNLSRGRIWQLISEATDSLRDAMSATAEEATQRRVEGQRFMLEHGR